MTGPTQTFPPSRSTETRAAGLPAGGVRIGPYCMSCRIGEGGMGAVCLAEREDQSHHQVTIKSSKFGPESAEPPDMRDPLPAEHYAERAVELTGDAPAGQPTPWARRLLEAKLTRIQKAAKGVRR